MLVQSGLYYPYIHIRKDDWLKAAALYWKRIDRIVPTGYPTRDSRTVQVLSGDLGFIEDRRPGAAAIEASQLFMDLLERHGDEIAQSMALQPKGNGLRRRSRNPVEDGVGDGGKVGFIYAEKLTPRLLAMMADAGLAFAASDEDSLRHRRISMRPGSTGWVGMDSRLAAAYMTVLARLTADEYDLNPVTDVGVAHAAMAAPDIEQTLGTLLPDMSFRSDRSGELGQRVALLAVQTVLPGGLGLVDVEDIVRFRQGHEELLAGYQSAVAAATNDLASLSMDVNEAVLRDRIIETTELHLLKPFRELERGLEEWGFKTVKSALTVELPNPLIGAVAGPVVSALTGNALYGVAAAVTVGVLSSKTVARSVRSRRSEGGSAANYLLEMRAGLTPKGAVRRQIDALIPK